MSAKDDLLRFMLDNGLRCEQVRHAIVVVRGQEREVGGDEYLALLGRVRDTASLTARQYVSADDADGDEVYMYPAGGSWAFFKRETPLTLADLTG